MKQIVPFIKKIELNTNVEEITSISLNHSLKTKDNNIITGDFSLYFEYKENDISVNILSYSKEIPFDIDLDNKYDLGNSTVDIDDFYYEIDDNEVTLHIDVLIDNIELSDEEMVNIIDRHDRSDEELLEIDNMDLFKEIDTDVKLEVKDLEKEETDIKEEIKIGSFNSEEEVFTTYKVHIVRGDDTVELICNKYGITKEELSYYNDIKEIKLGDKLIVPTNNNESNK